MVSYGWIEESRPEWAADGGEELKGLIGAAAVAIIAFVVYFFHGEYERRQYSRQMEKSRNLAKCDELVASMDAYKARTAPMPSKYKSEERFRSDVVACLRWKLDVLKGTTSKTAP